MTQRASPTPPTAGAGAGAPCDPAVAGCRSATPLSPSVLEKIAKCEKMKTDLEALQRDGWKVEWGPEGGGTHADRSTKVITRDPKNATDDAVVRSLAHEMGHAKYTLPPVTPNGRTREEYIRDKVQSNLEDEGEATLTEIEYKECVKRGGGPDWTLGYKKKDEYQATANKYPDAADRGKARTEIANVYGDGENPSNCPGQTYRQYYEKPCCEPGCGTGTRTWAESLTDDEWKAMGGKL